MYQDSSVLIVEDSIGTPLWILTLFSKSTAFYVCHLKQEAQTEQHSSIPAKQEPQPPMLEKASQLWKFFPSLTG